MQAQSHDCYDGYVYTIEGNSGTYSDRVTSKKYSVTSTTIKGYAVPNYSNNYDPNAPSDIKITGYDGPQEGDVLAVGANCGLYGTIISAHPLSKVWGGVYNRDGSKVGDYCYCSESTSTTSYSLRGTFNNSIIFDYLPEGFYTFQIEATDSKGYSTVVVSKNFQVGNPVVSYTVSLNANGGSVSPASITVSANGTYSGLPAPSRTGYTFAGWYTTQTGGTKKENGSSLASNSNHTLYTHWTANTYNVAFNANGGSGSMNAQTLTYDQSANLTANAFSKTGYSFVNWNTKADGSGTNYSDKASVKNLATGGAVTLYAIWTANKYTVKFDGNGADELSTASKEVTYNSTYGELPNSKRTGYNFIGWYTQPEGGSAISPDTKVTITGTQTLYAQWSVNKFLITFNATGGTSESAQKLVTYDKTYGVLPAAERTGYTFKGWYLDEACTQQITSDTIVASRIWINKN